MTAVVIGIIFIVLGLWGLVSWLSSFIEVLQGLGPISLLVGGVMALIAGMSSLKTRRRDEKSQK